MLLAQITVSNDFEGGNGLATFIDQENNEVHIVSELKGGDTKNIVYYVKISGLNTSLPLILAVDATWRGHTLVYSYDQINWFRSNLTALNNFNIPLTASTIFHLVGVLTYNFPHGWCPHQPQSQNLFCI